MVDTKQESMESLILSDINDENLLVDFISSHKR